MELERVFVSFSANKLRLLESRIVTCLDRLTAEQVWSRGSDDENAVGNLVLHLCGNVRQWIGFGVAALPDVRKRDSEFEAREGVSPEELRARITSVVADAAAVIEGLSAERLGETIEVQGYAGTVLEAVYHVVEHFSMHTGQIIYATKQLRGEDLGFYRHLSKKDHGERTP